MPIIFKGEKWRYAPKRKFDQQIKYGNGIERPYDGNALYLQKRVYDGGKINTSVINNLQPISQAAIDNILGTNKRPESTGKGFYYIDK